ncbi:MAG: DUF2878 domain-containing protein [Pseudomonadota bacterium]
MNHMVKNLILFKAGWVACVFGAANGMAWLGPLAVAAIAAEHLRTATAPKKEFMLLAIAAGIGVAWESALVNLGYLNYTSGIFSPNVAPYWIVAMWVLFATTLNVGMKWLKKHWVIAVIAGGIGGPMAFFAGEKAGAVVFTEENTTLLAIGIGWAILLPVLVQLSHRLNGHAEATAASPAQPAEV